MGKLWDTDPFEDWYFENWNGNKKMEGWDRDGPSRYEEMFEPEEPFPLTDFNGPKRIGIANVTKTFTFNIPEIKELIADYLRRVEGVGIDPNEIRVDVREPSFEGYSSSPARATFSAEVKGN